MNYDALSDKRVDDRRHEREKAYKEQQAARVAESQKSGSAGGSTSSTFDAFQRMATGKEGRTLAEKIADPNRPTWEQYKKVCMLSSGVSSRMHVGCFDVSLLISSYNRIAFF